jgi:hypothetical protein
LPADKLVEELFAGSSCWNNDAHNANAGINLPALGVNRRQLAKFIGIDGLFGGLDDSGDSSKDGK